MIPWHSHHTAALSDLVSPNKIFEWTGIHQQSFLEIKKAIMKATMLIFPDYTKPFEIYTDASQHQIGSVIMQRREASQPCHPIAYFSRKMNPAQQRYTVTEQELLSIVETLRTYRTMLFGYPLIIFTDYKNLIFAKFSSDRVICWHLYAEEFAPEFRYLPGAQNVVADALSLLKMEKQDSTLPATPAKKELYELSGFAGKCPIFFVLCNCKNFLLNSCKNGGRNPMDISSFLSTRKEGFVFHPHFVCHFWNGFMTFYGILELQGWRQPYCRIFPGILYIKIFYNL